MITRRTSRTAKQDSKLKSDRSAAKPKEHPSNYDTPSSLHYKELFAIWAVDMRTPTADSRRRWAMARNLDAAKFNNWWYRRKMLAKKAGIKIPDGTYELDVGTPPVISPDPVKLESHEDEVCVRVDPTGSSDIDVRLSSAAPTLCDGPNGSDELLIPSSDTAISTDYPEATEKCAYTHVSLLSRSSPTVRGSVSPVIHAPASSSPGYLPCSSPPITSPRSVSPGPNTATSEPEKTCKSLYELECNLGVKSSSLKFTCALCLIAVDPGTVWNCCPRFQ